MHAKHTEQGHWGIYILKRLSTFTLSGKNLIFLSGNKTVRHWQWHKPVAKCQRRARRVLEAAPASEESLCTRAAAAWPRFLPLTTLCSDQQVACLASHYHGSYWVSHPHAFIVWYYSSLMIVAIHHNTTNNKYCLTASYSCIVCYNQSLH